MFYSTDWFHQLSIVLLETLFHAFPSTIHPPILIFCYYDCLVLFFFSRVFSVSPSPFSRFFPFPLLLFPIFLSASGIHFLSAINSSKLTNWQWDKENNNNLCMWFFLYYSLQKVLESTRQMLKSERKSGIKPSRSFSFPKLYLSSSQTNLSSHPFPLQIFSPAWFILFFLLNCIWMK